MNEVLKQRLVGALILVALALIFWPIVFVEPEDKPVAQPQSIPEPPAVSTEAIEEPTDAGLRASPELTEYGESQESLDPEAQGNAGADGTEYVVEEVEEVTEQVASAPAAAASCLSLIAADSPAGPAPTTTTSYSIDSRGP